MLLEIKNVRKTLGSFSLQDISLELPAGYILGLIGPNGAGKTSLIHLLLGLYQPDHGEIQIDGRCYAREEPQIHDMLGYVLNEPLFDTAIALTKNAEKYGQFYTHYHADTLLDYLHRFELSPQKRFGQLSKGEKLKFQLAFALSHDARLLILDEPSGNFDPAFRRDFFQILKTFIADGTRSVLLSTHLTEDLDRMADYICYLEKGRVIFSGDIEALHEEYRLVSGEEYKIRLLRKADIIHIEKGSLTARALVRYRPTCPYNALTVTIPSLEELMYFITKR